MKHLSSNLIGIDQGEVLMFSDFEDGGPMWTGTGPRERRRAVWFGQKFYRPPAVQVAVSLWDIDTRSPIRAELTAEKITTARFEIVFRTWLETRVARLRVAWTAIGELPGEDAWEID